MEIKNFKDSFAKKLYGMTVDNAIAAGKCIACKDDAIPKIYSDAGKREYQISGLCEECFDNICSEE